MYTLFFFFMAIKNSRLPLNDLQSFISVKGYSVYDTE